MLCIFVEYPTLRIYQNFVPGFALGISRESNQHSLPLAIHISACSMPESFKKLTVFSLSEVAESIGNTLSRRYTSAFWVKAEMNRLNHYSHSGHCYPELMEKRDGKVISQMKSVLWKEDYIRIEARFLEVLKEPLKDGIKILFLAKITFDPVHGIALRIFDIDPSYTLGDLEHEKAESIRKLKQEGIFTRNKELLMPVIPMRIAVISVETSKGYADFRKILEQQSGKYAFFTMLFPSLLQGEKAVAAISTQLDQIRKVKHHFDVVAIIRGGGGDIGLSCYNHPDLARAVALFPLPVLTGIGHSTNETVCEMAAHVNAITPTQLGEWLVKKAIDFEDAVDRLARQIIMLSEQMLGREMSGLSLLTRKFSATINRSIFSEHTRVRLLEKEFKMHSRSLIRRQMDTIRQAATQLPKYIARLLEARKASLEMTGRQVQNLSPERVLERGYSITLFRGKALVHPDEVQDGDTIRTILAGGSLLSTVNEHSKTDQDDSKT